MHFQTQFQVQHSKEETMRRLLQDDALIRLFPAAKTEIVAVEGCRKTAETHYHALGREGTAIFHFHFLEEGRVQFEKVCDGKIWSEFKGCVNLEESDGNTQVRISVDGRTKPFVPEFTLKAPMKEEVHRMAEALHAFLDDEEVG